MPFVSGEASTRTDVDANSRLLVVAGVMYGLALTYDYDEIISLMAAEASDFAVQIDAGFTDLVGYMGDLMAQEESGTPFTPQQADLFGTEAQDRDTRLGGQVSQATCLLRIRI